MNENEEPEGDKEERMEELYAALLKAFKTKTELTLITCYHDAESRGDDLDGGSFAIEDAYQLTPAAERLKDKIERKHWVTRG